MSDIAHHTVVQQAIVRCSLYCAMVSRVFGSCFKRGEKHPCQTLPTILLCNRQLSDAVYIAQWSLEFSVPVLSGEKSTHVRHCPPYCCATGNCQMQFILRN